MITAFRQDFWALSREQKGYYALALRERWNLARALRRSKRHCHCCDDPEPRELVNSLFTEGLGFHPLADLAFEAIARAEARFSLRFVPQNSHEERLTGNLVSEIEAALFLIRQSFVELSQKHYGEPREIDFLYYDLSRGGTIEKNTGADLAIVLTVDLPDLPRMVRSAAFQAKKVNGSATIPKEQYQTLIGQFGDAAEYLFYDMHHQTFLPPMVLPASSFKDKAEKDPSTESFNVTLDEVDNGLPLSLWLLTRMSQGFVGKSEYDFNSAVRRFIHQGQDGGRLAVLSIGRAINTHINSDGGLDVSLSGESQP